MAAESVTKLFFEWTSGGSRSALDEMLPQVYDELHRIASNYLRRENAGHTLQPTALVNEAYLSLIDQRNVDWHNRAQFFGIAANLMRRILLKHARGKHAEKRGGPQAEKVELDAVSLFFEEQDLDLMALDEALGRLAARDEQKARVVELKFFAGLGHDEIADVIGRSSKTVERDWTFARAWLRRELGR